jgi:hypothetical protein
MVRATACQEILRDGTRRSRPSAKPKRINNCGGFRISEKMIAAEMQQLRERKTYSAVLHQGERPMSDVIPFRKPPSKPKEDDETAELLKLLERITKATKPKK